jgi:hypothetical protein
MTSSFTIEKHTDWCRIDGKDLLYQKKNLIGKGIPPERIHPVELWRVECHKEEIAADGLTGLSHAEAVAALEAFIADAQEALAKLKNKDE